MPAPGKKKSYPRKKTDTKSAGSFRRPTSRSDGPAKKTDNARRSESGGGARDNRGSTSGSGGPFRPRRSESGGGSRDNRGSGADARRPNRPQRRAVPEYPSYPPAVELPRMPVSQSIDHLARSMAGDEDAGDSAGIRLNRYLASAGYGSRRDVEKFITGRRVTVNGVFQTSPAVRVQSADTVELDGQRVIVPDTFLYVAMNKPAGYVVTARSFPDQRSIYELLPENLQTLRYAGRLDMDSHGLMIFSTDGAFIQKLTHPSHRITKKYEVTVDRLPEEEHWMKDFYRGIVDDGELLRVIRISILDRVKCCLEVILGQGKNRQIRRMFAARGIKVLDLRRTAVGFFDLSKKHIPEGKYVFFHPDELFSGQEELHSR